MANPHLLKWEFLKDVFWEILSAGGSVETLSQLEGS